jgi:hypothetical protein
MILSRHLGPGPNPDLMEIDEIIDDECDFSLAVAMDRIHPENILERLSRLNDPIPSTPIVEGTEAATPINEWNCIGLLSQAFPFGKGGITVRSLLTLVSFITLVKFGTGSFKKHTAVPRLDVVLSNLLCIEMVESKQYKVCFLVRPMH